MDIQSARKRMENTSNWTYTYILSHLYKFVCTIQQGEACLPRIERTYWSNCGLTGTYIKEVWVVYTSVQSKSGLRFVSSQHRKVIVKMPLIVRAVMSSYNRAHKHTFVCTWTLFLRNPMLSIMFWLGDFKGK